MALDPDISLKLIPLGGAQQAQFNPLEMMSTLQGIQNSQQIMRQRDIEIQNQQQQLAAKQRAASIIASSPDPESAMNAMAKDPLVAGFGGQFIDQYSGLTTALAQRRQLAASTRQTQVETQGKQTAQYHDAFSAGMGIGLSALTESSPDAARSRYKAETDQYLAGLPNEEAAAVKPMFDAKLNTIFAKGKSLDQMQNDYIGAAQAAGVGADQMAGYLPTQGTQSFGGQTQYGMNKGRLLGGGQANQFVPNSPAMFGATAPTYTPEGLLAPGIAAQPVNGAPNALGAPNLSNVPSDRAGPASAPQPAVGQSGAAGTQGAAGQPQPTGGAKLFDPNVDIPPPSIQPKSPTDLAPAMAEQKADAHAIDEFRGTGSTDQYNAAKVSQQQLAQLDSHLKNLSDSSRLLSPGAAGGQRLELMKLAETVSHIGGFDLSDDIKKQIGEGISAQKLTQYLGAELAKASTRGPEAAQVIQGFYGAVPGIENTPLGNRMVVASIQAQLARQTDLREFKEQYLATNKTLRGSDEAFARKPGFTTDDYVNKALAPLGMDKDGFNDVNKLREEMRSGQISPELAKKAIQNNPRLLQQLQRPAAPQSE